MRKTWVVLLATVVTLISTVRTTSAQTLTDGDKQFWGTFVLNGNLPQKLKVSFEEELRIGEDASDFYYFHAEGGLTYELSKSVSLGAGYRQVYEQKKERWLEERRPAAFVTLSWSWMGVEFSDRNRLEYRHREASTLMWRYRNKITAVFPHEWIGGKLQPFLSDELFVDLSEGEVVRNRIFAGVGRKLNKNVGVEAYYLLQTSRQSTGDWTTFHVVGSKLKLSF
ncbi:MAG: hypothetical protein G01um101420_918 [Parcubacteria group bacterium Gr01-1014_20]|nr:MAG: hypothetical protein G01um101420_918 [Parcubacteria group bacterium Gr01-1014_20]